MGDRKGKKTFMQNEQLIKKKERLGHDLISKF